MTSSRMTAVQVWVLVVTTMLFAWSLAGLIANPDFSTGDAVTTTRVLGVDFNGWHALSGFLLFGPGFVAARRHDWSLIFAAVATVSLVVTGLWALADHRPAEVFPFRHNDADAVLHLGSAAAYALALVLNVVPRRHAAA